MAKKQRKFIEKLKVFSVIFPKSSVKEREIIWALKQ
jgi:hypothetical protein